MTRLHPLQLVVDQFRESDGAGNFKSRRFSWYCLIPPAIAALVVVLLKTEIPAVAALLTATSILTGLIFTMALRFWERSIDARKDAQYALDQQYLSLLDQMRTHLAWTVIVGVASTAFLAGVSIFSSSHPPVAASAVAVFLLTYQLTLVLAALWSFYEASYLLRR